MMRKNVLLSMVKTVVFSMLVLVLASCSGGSAKMTGEGIYGELPNYLLKYVELKEKCAEDLEFEGNKAKQAEIVGKYAKQLAEILPESKINDLCSQLVKDTIPVVNHTDKLVAPIRVEAGKLKINFEKGISGEPTMTVHYDESPRDGGNLFFFLDENDSIVGATIGLYMNVKKGTAVVIPLGMSIDFKNKETIDLSKLSFFMLDKAKKLLIPGGKEEMADCVLRLGYSMKAIAKELETEKIIGHIDLDDEEKETSKLEAEEDKAGEDFSKPGAVDLAYFGLRGKVKSMDENNLLYTFSEKGKWETEGGTKLGDAYSEIKRDSQNRIVHYVIGEFDDMIELTITYDSQSGRVAKVVRSGGGEDTVTYTYDDKGYVIKEVCKGYLQEIGADEPTPVNTTTTYKYVSFDEHGNWTKREGKSSDGRDWEDYREFSYYE